ncbi:hypothetical protein FUAX_27360 [Fulvitalea axinellae]|uniref:DUF4468 domain-containing protein n=1 Tax=Fulvitalea axinellae TaxID=1182444 RepID=A0AAU9CDS9_9BACT|nr:hypothetical protein FUAX_27360 [Fulvitalea axinellae]
MKKILTTVFVLAMALWQPTMAQDQASLYPNLRYFTKKVRKSFPEISDDRKATLKRIGLYIKEKKNKGETAHIKFVGKDLDASTVYAYTWAKMATHFYSVKGVEISLYNQNGNTARSDIFSPLEKAGFIVYKDSVPSYDFFRIDFAFGPVSCKIFPTVNKKKHKPNYESPELLVFTYVPENPKYKNYLILNKRLPEDLTALNRQTALEWLYIFAHFRKKTTSH